jgi:hypothetical protein
VPRALGNQELRMTRRRPAATFSIAFALSVASSVLGQPSPFGNEFQVNSYTPGSQGYPAAAADAAGNFVIVWRSLNQDGSGDGVFARRFSSDGTALAAEFQVNSYTPVGQTVPAVAAESNGDFVVAWTDTARDGANGGIFARRFTSAGSALAAEFQVNTFTSGQQYGPAVGMDADGDFVIAWSSDNQDGLSYGVFARRFSAAGSPLAVEFQVNLYTPTPQQRPSVASETNGDFVVVWNSSLQDGGVFGVFGRRFSSTGAPIAAEFQVNAYTPGYQGDGAVAMDADGDFVVAWASPHENSNYGIFARRFSSAGQPVAVEFQVNVYTPNYQLGASVRSDSDGDFVITWFSAGQDSDDNGVFARAFSRAGEPTTGDLQVNTYVKGNQRNAVIAGAGSKFVVTWHDGSQDGSVFGVFAQRFKIPIPLDVDGDGLVQPLTDLLLGLRYSFGFRGATLITGAVGGACTRCDAPSIEAYLAALTE